MFVDAKACDAESVLRRAQSKVEAMTEWVEANVEPKHVHEFMLDNMEAERQRQASCCQSAML